MNTSVAYNPEQKWAMQHTIKASIWVWLAYAALFAVLLYFGQWLIAIGLLIYIAVRVISSILYERYIKEYRDYESDHYELFRDINDILGVNSNASLNGLSTDIDEMNKQQVEEEKKLLYELQRKNNYEMTRRERWQLAILSERYNATTEPLKLFLVYKADYPNDLDVDYLIGKVLLEKNNKSGLTFLKKAFRKFNLILPICELLTDYYFRTDNEVKLNYWAKQKNTFNLVANKAKLERISVTPLDDLVEASLSEKWLEEIGTQLASIKGVKAAWICEKIVKHYPEYPVYILSVKRKHLFIDDQKLLSILNSELDLPDTTIVITLSGRYKKQAKKAKKMGVRIDIPKQK